MQHGVAQALQKIRVCLGIEASANAIDDLDPARRPDPAWRALAAGFNGAELHGEACLFGHVDRVIEGDDAAVAEHRANRGEGFVVDWRVELRFRQIGTQRTADLHGADWPATRRATAKIMQQFTHGHPERQLDQAAALDVSGQLDRQGAARTAHAHVAIPRRAMHEDIRQRGQGDDVVDDRGLAEQTLDGRQRRLETHLAATPFEAFQHRGFLAANVGTRAHAQLDIEIVPAALDVGTEPALCTRASKGFGKHLLRQGIFAAQVDIALARSHRQTGDQHALDQPIRITFHEHAVGKSAGITFVGIADNVFLRIRLIEHGLPFDATGKRRAATSAQARISDRLHDIGGCHAQRILDATPAAMGAIVVQGQRVGDAVA